jgi:SAM-dependent methyltransferase
MKKIYESSTNTKKNEFVFVTDEEGHLSFRGDFEGLYENDCDPWAQSAQGESAEYYVQSRNRVANFIVKKQPQTVLEIGCGLGFALKHFNNIYSCRYTGWDISKNAISKAKHEHPDFVFKVEDICSPELVCDTTFDTVILNQLLWYILPQLDSVMASCLKLLNKNGSLIISNAFAREQRFGNEYIDGFGGAFNYFSSKHELCKLIHAEFNDDGFRNLDGLFVFENAHTSKLNKGIQC